MINRVAVITGFYQSPHFLIHLFRHLNNQVFKDFDVYVYNYSIDEIPELDNLNIWFNYKILKLNENVGFAGGNNHAIQEAKKNLDYSYYALINDDTKPDVNWLKSLVDCAASHPAIGAVTSKIVYYEPYIFISGKTQAVKGDVRELGIRFYTNSHFEDCYYDKHFHLKGFHLQEEDEINTFRWTESSFQVALPVSIDNSKLSYKVKLFLRKNQKVEEQKVLLYIGDTVIDKIELEEDTIFYELEVPAKIIHTNKYFIIQNAGSDYDHNFNGFDIGSGEIDKGQYNLVREVNMFCGGACLLSKQALHDAGLFNSHFFSYYEDSDLSVRIKRNGYKIIYAPDALVLHYHSGTSQEWSPFFTYHVFRNKIIFSGKNFGIKAFFSAFKERWKETWMFLKWAAKNRFIDPKLKARVRLNFRILVDSIIGIFKYNPAKF